MKATQGCGTVAVWRPPRRRTFPYCWRPPAALSDLRIAGAANERRACAATGLADTARSLRPLTDWEPPVRRVALPGSAGDGEGEGLKLEADEGVRGLGLGIREALLRCDAVLPAGLGSDMALAGPPGDGDIAGSVTGDGDVAGSVTGEAGTESVRGRRWPPSTVSAAAVLRADAAASSATRSGPGTSLLGAALVPSACSCSVPTKENPGCRSPEARCPVAAGRGAARPG